MKLDIKINDEDLKFAKFELISKNIIQESQQELKGILRTKTPKDKGHLHSNWVMVKSQDKLIATNSTKYAKWVDQGTGIYGPRHRRIFPKNNRVLVFTPGVKYRGKYGPMTKNGKYVFRSIKGQQGQHYVKKSVETFTQKIPKIIQNAVERTKK